MDEEATLVAADRIREKRKSEASEQTKSRSLA